MWAILRAANQTRFAGTSLGVSDGTRTRGRRDHNPELYQLSYAHQAFRSLAANPGRESVVQ